MGFLKSLKVTVPLLLASVIAMMAPVNAASPELQDRAVAAGISLASTPSWDVCVGDVDADGDTDVHASLHMKNPGMLFANNNDGSFTRVAYQMISPRPTPGYTSKALVDRHACAMADVDGNGLTDVYNSAGRWASNKYKDESINNEMWLQVSPGVFRDVATAAGVGEPCTRGRHVVFADYSGDGRPDMFLGAQVERADSADPCNKEAAYPYNEQPKVFVNKGNDSATGEWLGFRTAPEFNVSVPNTGVRMALNWDYNHDGRPDLLTLSFPNRKPLLYQNTGTGFQEVSQTAGLRLGLMNGGKVGDITGDGIDDLVLADNNGFAYRAGTATGLSATTVRLGAVPSNADGWSVALGDANGDGKLDIYGLVAGAPGITVNPDDVLFVSNANDSSYRTLTVPSATGDANDVDAVTVSGRSQFVVLNGGNDEKETPGPVQLIAYN